MKVILGKAAAASNNKEFPKEEIHAVLMFVKTEDDNSKAQKLAKTKMQKKGWKKLKMSRIGAVNTENFNPEDERIKTAFTTAQELGFGLLVYPEIEKDLML